VYLRDITGGTTILVSKNAAGTRANGHSKGAKISGDGSKVVYVSDATNLVTDDNSNTAGDEKFDAFAYTVSTGAVDRISVNHLGQNSPGSIHDVAINTDGKVFAFAGKGTFTNTSPSVSDRSHVYVVDQNCAADDDSDSTNNCSDACPQDLNKIAAGTCGCGAAETDSDADGFFNCVDECPADAAKHQRGSCGCGNEEADSDANGVADCLQVTAATVPERAVLTCRNGKTIGIVFPTGYAGARYTVRVKRGSRIVATVRTRSHGIKYRLNGSGYFYVTYRVTEGAITSKSSRKSTAFSRRSGKCQIIRR